MTYSDEEQRELDQGEAFSPRERESFQKGLIPPERMSAGQFLWYTTKVVLLISGFLILVGLSLGRTQGLQDDMDAALSQQADEEEQGGEVKVYDKEASAKLILGMKDHPILGPIFQEHPEVDTLGTLEEGETLMLLFGEGHTMIGVVKGIPKEVWTQIERDALGEGL